MATITSIFSAVARRLSPLAYSDGNNAVAMNNRGELLVAPALPPFAELTRMGNAWSVAIATGSAFQPVAAWPTTLANIVLYNGNSTGGKSFVVDTIWAAAITSIAAATSFTCLAQISNAGVAAPTNDTAQLITSKAGIGTYAGNAKRAVANTAFMVASKWTVVGQSSGHPSTAIGAGVFADIAGRIIVPPGACLGVNVCASTAGGTMIQGIDWFEVQLDLGSSA